MQYVTYDNLIQVGILIVALIGLFFQICNKNRVEIRFANLTLISSRQMPIRVCTMVACLVAITKNNPPLVR